MIKTLGARVTIFLLTALVFCIFPLGILPFPYAHSRPIFHYFHRNLTWTLPRLDLDFI